MLNSVRPLSMMPSSSPIVARFFIIAASFGGAIARLKRDSSGAPESERAITSSYWQSMPRFRRGKGLDNKQPRAHEILTFSREIFFFFFLHVLAVSDESSH